MGRCAAGARAEKWNEGRTRSPVAVARGSRRDAGKSHVVQTSASGSADKQRSILASARETLVRPLRVLSALQARFTFSKMSLAFAVQMYGLGLRLCCSI